MLVIELTTSCSVVDFFISELCGMMLFKLCWILSVIKIASAQTTDFSFTLSTPYFTFSQSEPHGGNLRLYG